MEEMPLVLLSLLALAMLVGGAILPTIGIVLDRRDRARGGTS